MAETRKRLKWGRWLLLALIVLYFAPLLPYRLDNPCDPRLNTAEMDPIIGTPDPSGSAMLRTCRTLRVPASSLCRRKWPVSG